MLFFNASYSNQVQRGERICMLHPIKKQRTPANNTVFTTKAVPQSTETSPIIGGKQNKSSGQKKLRSKWHWPIYVCRKYMITTITVLYLYHCSYFWKLLSTSIVSAILGCAILVYANQDLIQRNYHKMLLCMYVWRPRIRSVYKVYCLFMYVEFVLTVKFTQLILLPL